MLMETSSLESPLIKISLIFLTLEIFVFISFAIAVNSPFVILSEERDNFIRDLLLSKILATGSFISAGRYFLLRAIESFTRERVFILFALSLSVKIIAKAPGVIVVSVLSIPLIFPSSSSISRTAILSMTVALAPLYAPRTLILSSSTFGKISFGILI